MAVSRVRRVAGLAAVGGLVIVTLLITSIAGGATAPDSRSPVQVVPASQLLADSAFPTAEAIHVVAVGSDGKVIETWSDQVSGDAVRKTTDQKGALREVVARQVLTISTYVMTDRSTGLHQETVLSKDNPVLTGAVSQLDGYRWGLEHGGLVKLGQETFSGQPALKVGSADISGAPGPTIYLDPATLYPLGLVAPDGDEYTFKYRLIETLRRADAPAGVFQFNPPPTDFSEIYQALSADDIARFASYPLVNLGPALGAYTLDSVQRFQSRGTGFAPSDADAVYSSYQERSATGATIAQIQVKVRKPLTNQERADNAKAEC